MDEEQKRKLTSEEMVRRARENLDSTHLEDPDAAIPITDQSDIPQEYAFDDDSQVRQDLASSLREELSRRETLEPSSSPPFEESITTPAPPPVPSTPVRTAPIPQPQPTRTGLLRRLPIGWLIVGLVFAGGSVYNFFTSADRDETGAVVGAGEVASDDLRVGDCLLYPDEVGADGSFEFESLTAVPCSEPHDMEIFAQIPGPAGAYPGVIALTEYGQEQCAAPFESYVGLPVEHEARLIYSISYPFQEGWDAGDRTLDCVIETWDGSQLAGSQMGAGLLGVGGLVVNSCYDFVIEDTYVSFTELSCDQPHLVQMIASEILPDADTAPYPGDNAIDTAGGSICADYFSLLVPTPSEELDYFWITPDSETWLGGDRLVQCHLVSFDGEPFVGSYTAGG